MSASGAATVGRAYDRIAEQYDRAVAEDLWLRRYLWRRYLKLFPPGSRILELACGTGLDTLFLLSNGMSVTAVDISPAMTDELRRKLCDHPQGDCAEVLTMDISDLGRFRSYRPFDGVVSAFAGLNTVADLPGLSAELAEVLRPGARGLLHLLAPAGIWRYLRRWRRAGRFAAEAERARKTRRAVIEGIAVDHRVQELQAVRQELEGHLSITRAGTMGVLWPRSWGERISRLDSPWPARLDAWAGRSGPIKGWGRFLVLEVERP